MRYLWPRAGRMPRLVLLVVVGFAFVGSALTLPALASTSSFGGQLYYTGGDVTIDVLHYDTIYGETLQLRMGDKVIDVADCSLIGSHVTLTQQQLVALGITRGDELQFGVHVKNTNQTYAMGPGTRNSDGIDHAYLRAGRGGVYAGFEDLYGGGDRDYNDTVFRFTGVSTAPVPQITFAPAPTPDRSPAVPEPATVGLLLTGIGALGIAYRKR